MLPAIAAGVSIASSLGGMAAGLSANKDARKAARLQARLTYNQRMQEIRDIQKENEYTQGYNRAAVGASNILMTGSAKRHMDMMQSEMNADVARRRNAAVNERKAIRSGAPGGSDNFATVAQGMAGIGSSLLYYHNAGG